MPVYGTFVLPASYGPGDSHLSIGVVAITSGLPVITGEASALYPNGTQGERCALQMTQDGSQRTISAELSFSVNPGAYEIDVMDADTDAQGAYQLIPGGAITGAPTQFAGAGRFYIRVELPTKAKFALLFVKTQPGNACNIIGKINA